MQVEFVTITRRLGLLDGNLMGMFLPPNSSGTRGCAATTPTAVRAGRQHWRRIKRSGKHRERQAINACVKKYPNRVKWCRKPKASLRTMEYMFSTQGPSGLVMINARVGARRSYSLGTVSTSIQGWHVCGKGKSAASDACTVAWTANSRTSNGHVRLMRRCPATP